MERLDHRQYGWMYEFILRALKTGRIISLFCNQGIGK